MTAARTVMHHLRDVLRDTPESSSDVVVGATAIALKSFLGEVELVPVRAFAFSRGLVTQLGQAFVPSTVHETRQLETQLTRGFRSLGSDGEHWIVTAAGLAIETSTSAAATYSAGHVPIEPFVFDAPAMHQREWLVPRLRFGVTIAYERRTASSLLPQSSDLSSRRVRKLATRLIDELAQVEPRRAG